MDNDNEKYVLNIYDPVTGETKDIEVTEDVYHAYRRSGWNIKDNNHSFYAHEIQISGLIGGEDGNCENFREFKTDSDDLEQQVIVQLNKEALHKVLSTLSDEERQLIMAIYFYGKTERAYAAEINVSQQAVNKRKRLILKKLQNLLNS